MTWTASFYFLYSLLCCKYIFVQVKQQHIYLQDYRGLSVAVSQKRNDHMQVYIIFMENK